MTHYPVYLDLNGRRCVVLGGGALADEKARGLRAAGADVAHRRRGFRASDFDGAFLAIDATGDVESQRASRAAADRQHVLLNVVDVSSRCDWIAPAVVRRGPLQIAISTGGESPFLASHLRGRLERDYGDEWARFTEIVGAVRRRLRRRGVAMPVQERAYRRLLRSEARALLRSGDEEAALAAAAAIESAAYAGADSTGEVVLVGAGPGSAGLLTLEGRELLAHADVVFHDALVDAEVLRLCGGTTRVVDVGKRGGRRSTPQAAINEMLIAAARDGELVVRLKGGDPFVFGRGGEEVAALVDAGVAVRAVPGVSAVVAAPAAAGIALTHRGVAASLAVTTGRRAADAPDTLRRLARSADTLVVLMPEDVQELTARLSAVLGRERPAALIAAATTARQQVVRTTLGRLAALARTLPCTDPATLVVGEVVAVATARDAASRLGTVPLA